MNGTFRGVERADERRFCVLNIRSQCVRFRFKPSYILSYLVFLIMLLGKYIIIFCFTDIFFIWLCSLYLFLYVYF